MVSGVSVQVSGFGYLSDTGFQVSGFSVQHSTRRGFSSFIILTPDTYFFLTPDTRNLLIPETLNKTVFCKLLVGLNTIWV
jgi:hypothetical protein